MALKQEDIARVKGLGFLINKNTGKFSGRLVPICGIFSADELKKLSELAEKFGDGKVAFTVRMTAEIVGIPYEKIDEAIAFAEKNGLHFGGTGAKVRPVTSCKGTTCVYGNYDTQALAKEIHEKYYVGWTKVALPHKFKIGVGGCPNSCIKPSLNDFGIEGHHAPVYSSDDCKGCKVCQIEQRCPMKAAKMENGKLVIDTELCNTCGVCIDKCPFGALEPAPQETYQIFVGGTWGKHSRIGTPLSRMVAKDEIFSLIEKSILWYKENGFEKERFGAVIDRIGMDQFEKDISGDDLLNRKDEILALPLRKKN